MQLKWDPWYSLLFCFSNGHALKSQRKATEHKREAQWSRKGLIWYSKLMFCSVDKVGDYPIQIPMLIEPPYVDLEIQLLNTVFSFLSHENTDWAWSTKGCFHQILTIRLAQGCLILSCCTVCVWLLLILPNLIPGIDVTPLFMTQRISVKFSPVCLKCTDTQHRSFSFLRLSNPIVIIAVLIRQ